MQNMERLQPAELGEKEGALCRVKSGRHSRAARSLWGVARFEMISQGRRGNRLGRDRKERGSMGVDKQKRGEGGGGSSRAHYYSHFGALADVIERGLSLGASSQGGKWLAEFAADSRRIGEELAMLREDASEAVKEHYERLGQGFSSLSKLHCIFMCQASAASLAKSISESGWLSEGQGDEEEGRMLSLAIGRTFGLINDDEKQPWVALLNDELSRTLPSWGFAQQKALGARISKSQNFTNESLFLMNATFANSMEAIRGRLDPSISATAFVSSSGSQSETLLDFAHGPNDIAHELMHYAKHFFHHDPSAQLEARFYSLRQVYAYDHSQLMSRYPNGLYDGLTMLLPIAAIGAGMGGKKALDNAMHVLSRAAREAARVEDESGAGPERVAPGALAEILLAAGLPKPAKILALVPLEEQRVRAGCRSSDVVDMLAAATVEGLGFEGALAHGEARSESGLLNGALREAAWHGLVDRVGDLLAEGADASSESSQGSTPLMLAASANSANVVAQLIPLGNVNAVDFYGKSALHYAAMATSAECCVAMLAAICDPNAQDSEGRTALTLAMRGGHSESVAILAPITDLSLRTNDGETARQLAERCEKARQYLSLLDSILEQRMLAEATDGGSVEQAAHPGRRRSL